MDSIKDACNVFNLIDYVKSNGIDFKGQNIRCLWLERHAGTNDNNYSLQINANGYKCHACGASGGIIDFLTKYHNIDQKTAAGIVINSVGGAIKHKLGLKKKEPEKVINKYHFRILIPGGDRSFIAKSENEFVKKEITQEFVNEYNIIFKKEFTLDGIRLSGCITSESVGKLSLGIIMRNCWVHNTGKLKTVIVEGLTDYVSCLSNNYIENNYNIVARKNKTAKNIPIFPGLNLTILDPDDDIKDTISYYALNDAATLKYINLQEITGFKDISDYLYKKNDFKEIETKFIPYVSENNSVYTIFWSYKNKVIIQGIELYKELQNRGFYIHNNNLQKTTEIRRIHKNIVYEYTNNMFTNYCTNEFIDEMPDEVPMAKEAPTAKINKELIRSALMSNTFVNTQGRASHLRSKKIDINKDTIDTTFFYFPEKVVAVRASGIEELNYTDLDKPVHHSQILKPEMSFELLSESEILNRQKDFYFYNFIQNLCTNPVTKELDKYRFAALKYVIGYMLHKCNLDYYQKLIILTETNVTGTAEGGTGKGILSKSLKYFNNIVNIDGKNINKNDNFMWDEVNEQTNTIILNDVEANFSLEKFYNAITDGLSVNQKGNRKLFLPPEYSPKLILSTNYAIDADRGSSRRRRYELEIFQYYSEKFSPFDEFKRMIYRNFTLEEWNLFYNLYIRFNFMFMKKLCIPAYVSDTAKIRQFISKYSLEMYEYLKQYFTTNDNWVSVKSLYNEINTYFGNVGKYELNANKMIRILNVYSESVNKILKKEKSSSGEMEIKFFEKDVEEKELF